jgi:hypothetical protein
VISYRDGDYSFGLHWERNDEIGDLVDAHNALGAVLREQRLDLVQRELLLDTMVQNTPVRDDAGRRAGADRLRQCFRAPAAERGAPPRGLAGWRSCSARTFRSMREASSVGATDFSRPAASGKRCEEEIYHLARRGFT